MGDWPALPSQRNAPIGVNTSISTGTVITGNATPHVKGAYTELIASTPFDATMLEISLGQNFPVASTTEALVDIAIGAAASEIVIINNLGLSCVANGTNQATYHFPIALAAGTRLAARLQASLASQPVNVFGRLFAATFGSMAPLSRVETWGAITATSSGTAVDSGGVANTLGAWFEFIGTTAHDVALLIRGLVLNNANFSNSTIHHLHSIGVGAAGSEVPLIEHILSEQEASLDQWYTSVPTYPVHIPAGSRVSMRQQANSTDLDRITADILYGIG